MNIGHTPEPENIISLLHISRSTNTPSKGKPFDSKTINAVWEKAEKEFGYFFFRRDIMGSVIAKHDYGKKDQYGWEIVHIVPVSEGGTDDMDNLRPLHWENVPLKGEQ